MKPIIAIAIGVSALALVILAFYYLWYKPRQNNGGGTGTQTCPDGSVIPVAEVCPKNIPDGTGSTSGSNRPPVSIKVNGGDVTEAHIANPFYENEFASQVVSSKVAPLPLIHYETNFANGCFSFIWYKGGYYANISESTNAQGIKSCYYRFLKGYLPKEIRIKNTTAVCATYQYYLSGELYVYDRAQTEPTNQGINYYCIYKIV